MNLQLKPISLTEDKTEEIYASEDCQSMLTMWEEFYPRIGFTPPWTGYMIRRGDEIVGTCALIRNSADNRAEISYWTFKQHEGLGIASWACEQLVSLARSTDSSVILFGKTEPRENASTKVLKRNGFVFSKIVQDHEIGDAWEWVLE